jgi:methyl-accepting chemotaxis protein
MHHASALPDFDLERRLRYAGIDKSTSRRLRGFWRVVRLALPSILNDFYNHVESEPHLARLTSGNVNRLKGAQTTHWERLFSGEFDQAYMVGVYHVGLAHKKIGLEPRWYIAGYQFVLNRLMRLAVFTWFWNPYLMWRTLQALNKAVMLDMDLAIFAYQHAIETDKRQQEEAIIASVGVGLNALADGNLTHRVTTELSGSLEKLKIDFNAAVPKLQQVLAAVVQSVDTISTGASEIEQASDDLSRRTENQAASLEQTAAALEEITATVKATAGNAGKASAIVTRTKNAAQSSGHIVESTISAMSQIEQSSKQITDIIGVIDEIAFQTNLLALNAGVEAARAGDAGRGFAVVASEVRALAQRSSQAAKEIKALISASSEHVTAGVKFVGQSGAALHQIVAEIVEINELVTEIAQAAGQQSTGIEEVNAAVNQMDQVTQQNAAMVEEATAAAHHLAAEAQNLAGLVANFEVGVSLRGVKSMAEKSKPEKPRMERPKPAPVRAVKARAQAAVAAPAGELSADDWTEF